MNEAFSAGSLDASSTVVPAAMERVALGAYEAQEFDGPMLRCLDTELVVFSGLKTDKLDDLEAMIGRGTVKMVFTAGSLAMALKKAAAELAGGQFSLGVAEDPAHADKPYYIPPATDRTGQTDAHRRARQRHRVRAAGRLRAGQMVALPPTIGPANSSSTSVRPPATCSPQKDRRVHCQPPGPAASAAFHNGVFGKFEEPQFAEGTKRFVSQLKRLKDAGVEVYVGGGEGGAALEQYGQPRT